VGERGQGASVKALEGFPERQHLDAKVAQRLHPAAPLAGQHETREPGSSGQSQHL
jgi:hypothetical protein